jgi:thiamine pyrophosphate-dependent acetolactate synthase large subunit-like protein
LDGDGNLLMGFGGLAQVGALRPGRLHHVVLDNACYATTGGQRCLSRDLPLRAAARAVGYAWAERCDRPEEAAVVIAAWLEAPGPAFLDLAVAAEDPDPAPRIPMTPGEMARRFREALGREE